MSTDLRSALADHVDSLVAPPGDLTAVVREGRRIRGRRRVSAAIRVAAVLALGGVLGSQLLPGGSDRAGEEERFADQPIGTVENGLRAYADPGVVLHYGGRSLSASGLEGLDTDAVGTPYGVVMYDGYRPVLVGLDGRTEWLMEDTNAYNPDFRPTARADVTSSLVVVGVLGEEGPELRVIDVRTREQQAASGFVAPAADVVIDAFDDGVVFYRDDTGTQAWDVDAGTTTQVAGPDTRIADVRNGVVLYDGAAPSPEPGTGLRDYRFVPGAIDSQLTHDGRHVLAWSSTLQPTGAGEPLRLSVTEEDGATHWSIDTDGSVLVAARDGALTRIHDCDPRTGACELVDELEITGGDPMFLGNDM